MGFKNKDPNTVTHVAILVVLIILRQSRRDSGIENSTIPNPGIENSSPWLQSLCVNSVIESVVFTWSLCYRARKGSTRTTTTTPWYKCTMIMIIVLKLIEMQYAKGRVFLWRTQLDPHHKIRYWEPELMHGMMAVTLVSSRHVTCNSREYWVC